MIKPSSTLLALAKLGRITRISVDYRQTGNESAETICVLTGSKWNGEQMLSTHYKGLLNSVEKYLELKPDFKSVARLTKNAESTIDRWEKYKKDNALDLAEYERLKAKLEVDSLNSLK